MSMNPTNTPYVLKHHFTDGGLAIPMFVGPSKPDPQDLDLCARLCRAYVLACRDTPDTSEEQSGLWADVQMRHHAALIDALSTNNVEALADMLCNGLRCEAAFGLGSGPGWFALASNADLRVGTITLDRLLSLAEAIGVCAVENPETEHWGRAAQNTVSSLTLGIETELGIEIGLPKIFGLFGIETDSGLINVRTPDHVYTAWRISQLLKETRGNTVIEIGGGFGGCALYSARLGARHEIYDLPTTNAMQGYFLAKALGEDVVRFYGEDDRGQSVHLLPNWAINAVAPGDADIVFCHDVLPELSVGARTAYLARISKIAPTYFYTINHEHQLQVAGYETAEGDAQVPVSRQIAQHQNFKRYSRTPYWIRSGYVEELYRIMIP